MDKYTVFWEKKALRLRGNLICLDSPKVMGILNLTPDSFYSGSRFGSDLALLKKAEEMLDQGAFILDIGAYSSRPGAPEVSEQEEEGRLVPSLKRLVSEFPDAYFSVDTFRSAVARKAAEAGASVINDISGGTLDPEMFATIASLDIAYVLMHMRGSPETMIHLNEYEDLILDLIRYFQQKLEILTNLGVRDIILDPGFGFAKNINQNFSLLKELSSFSMLEYPVLAGLSRKSLIYKTLNVSAEEAMPGTIALNMVALQQGAVFLRVHDVREAVETIKLFNKLYF